MVKNPKIEEIKEAFQKLENKVTFMIHYAKKQHCSEKTANRKKQ